MAAKGESYTIWYDEMEGKDFPLVGKGNADLGEMIKAGIRVSPGFAVTLYANEKFLVDTGIKEKIGKFLEDLGDVNFESTKRASAYTMELLESAPVPSEISEDILRNCRRLSDLSGLVDVPVGVRSSGVMSMPGPMETYMNVRGEKDLLDCVKKCWSSPYTVEALMYRANKGMGFLFNVGVGIPKMVNSRVSGIIFTINPANGDISKMSIEASYGLGEAVIRGMVTPDRIMVDKGTGDIIKTTVGAKEIQCVYRESGGDVFQTNVPRQMREKLSLSRDEIRELCRLGKLVESYYGKPYDIEFGIDTDLPFPKSIIVLQVKPESVWSRKEARSGTKKRKDPMERILSQLLTGEKEK
jgi:pyruvate, water dikinase